MTVQEFDLGQGVRATGTFKDLDGDTADPTAVVCKVKDPLGNITSPSPANPSTGVYYTDITLNKAGKWYVRFEGTGAIIAADEETIRVRDSEFYPSTS